MCARRLVLPALLALAAAPPPTAAASDLPARGPVLALRGGVGEARGRVSRDGPELRDLVERKAALGLELGYRLTRHLWAELQFDFAGGSAAGPLCTGGTACSVTDGRFGVGFQLRLLPDAWIDPWVGVGAGLEVLNAEGFDAATSLRTERSWAGVELPWVDAGVDLALSSQLGIGPWASLTVSRFTSESVKPQGGATVSGSIHGRSTHAWVTGGLRATLKL